MVYLPLLIPSVVVFYVCLPPLCPPKVHNPYLVSTIIPFAFIKLNSVRWLEAGGGEVEIKTVTTMTTAPDRSFEDGVVTFSAFLCFHFTNLEQCVASRVLGFVVYCFCKGKAGSR